MGVISANVALNTCLDTGDPTYCALIVRQHTTGGLTGNNIAGGGYIVQQNLNIANAEVSGVDLQTAYLLHLPGDSGSLSFAMNGAYLLTAKTTPLPGAHTYDCAGLYGNTCQTVNPRWRHNLRTTWSTPWNFDVALTWRFVGSVSLDNNDSDPTLDGAEHRDPDTGEPLSQGVRCGVPDLQLLRSGRHVERHGGHPGSPRHQQRARQGSAPRYRRSGGRRRRQHLLDLRHHGPTGVHVGDGEVLAGKNPLVGPAAAH